jgi:DNA polymerase
MGSIPNVQRTGGMEDYSDDSMRRFVLAARTRNVKTITTLEEIPGISKPYSISSLRSAATHCRACPLWQKGTQTVFGEGPAGASVVLVGEQPGNDEDLAGKPFVGAAGKLLDRALAEAGIVRGDVYVTNAVKHFKWEPRGKRRLHKKQSWIR